ncbi:MAG TPA: LptE family protein [Bacteroidia bacterium]|nr:LptE family protein [Bacteroidia bacterium]
MKKFAFCLLPFAFCLFASGCKVNYSFTGASVSPDIKTFSVKYFQNNAPIVNPSLSQAFTEKLKDKIISQASLSHTDKQADLIFEGDITGYSTAPIAIQSNETAALNRLTISIRVKFTNLKNEKQNFETSFSRYADYSSQENLASVEQQLTTTITDQIVDDIFNKVFINW